VRRKAQQLDPFALVFYLADLTPIRSFTVVVPDFLCTSFLHHRGQHECAPQHHHRIPVAIADSQR
jgi:hypothetical protein